MDKLKETIAAITELDAKAMAAAQERQDQLTKPAGSLGVLEDISIKLAGITGNLDIKLERKTSLVVAGDHGVAARGVSAFPAEVTPQMVANFSRGGAAINVLARHVGAEVKIVDAGVNAEINDPNVIDKKIRYGTDDFTQGPAMSRAEAEAALTAGVEVAEAEVRAGVDIIGVGDMGIGNTTASTAIMIALTGAAAESVTGRGTGVDERKLQQKISAVKKAIEFNQPDKADAVDVLAKVGGLEIGALAGIILGAAAHKVPVVIDGFITAAAALIAARLAPKSVNYMFASHVSVEPGHKLILNEIGLSPMLYMDMRLGEGTGAALAISTIEAAAKILNEMATFAEAQVSEKEANANDAVK